MKIRCQLLMSVLVVGSLCGMELEDFKGKNPTDSLKILKKEASMLRVSDIEKQLDNISERNVNPSDDIISTNEFKKATSVGTLSRRSSGANLGIPPLTASKERLEEIAELHQPGTNLAIVTSMLDLMKEESEKNPITEDDLVSKFNQNSALKDKLCERVNKLRESENPHEKEVFVSLTQYSTERERKKRKHRSHSHSHGRDSIALDKELEDKTKSVVWLLLIDTLKKHTEEQTLLIKALHEEKETVIIDNKNGIRRKNWQLGISIVIGTTSTLIAAVIAIVPELVRKCTTG